jgi:hypothetical protein
MMNINESQVSSQLEKQGWHVIRNGWPDFLCVRNGVVKAVEVKGNISRRKNQRENHAALQMAGLTVEVIEAVPFEQLRDPCPECGSGQTYFRRSTAERVCRMCGSATPVQSS